jgi:hypothetical protein
MGCSALTSTKFHQDNRGMAKLKDIEVMPSNLHDRVGVQDAEGNGNSSCGKKQVHRKHVQS